LRALDCFVPSGLGDLLKDLFEDSEGNRRYSYMPGWAGIDEEEVNSGVDGPGDFAAAFKPHMEKFDGLGTEQTGGKRRCASAVHRTYEPSRRRVFRRP
jgi:hypothetical protein